MVSALLAHVSPRVQRLNVRQYHQMFAAGILREGEPLELIDGLVLHKDRSDQGGDPMSHGPRHASTLRRLQELEARLPLTAAHLRLQLPITLSEVHEPEPDGALVRGLAAAYEHRHPCGEDVLLVVEVADSSLDYDRTTKQRVYAAAGIPAYWIINLRQRTIEVYAQPDVATATYGQRRDYAWSESITLDIQGIAPTVIEVASLLPASR